MHKTALRPKPIPLTKLAAARRQLQTAIQLWFAEGDAVAIHTLAYAAYEIIHVVSRAKRKDALLFDTPVVKDEYRNEWVRYLKKDANFFKHANKDADGTTVFNPFVSELLMLHTIYGIKLMGEQLNNYEGAFNFWHSLHNGRITIEEWLSKFVSEPSNFKQFQRLSKPLFLAYYIDLRMQLA